MRFPLISILALLIGGCTTIANKAERTEPKIELTYELSIWAVDQRNLPIGKERNRDAKFDQIPSTTSQNAILRLAKSSEIQIASSCQVNASRLVNCDSIETSPRSAKLAEHARAFLEKFKISADSLSTLNPAPNFGYVQMRISVAGTKLGASGRCILVPECGVPTPPPPPPPQRR